MDLEKIFFHTHVGGEYNKLKDSYTGLTRTGIDALNATEKGIYSDCFLLHARNLIDFLFKERGFRSCEGCKNCNEIETCKIKALKKQEDDVLALDFVKNGKPIATIMELIPQVEGKEREFLYVRINKQLSHITKSRKDNIDFFDEREAYYKKIFENINKVLGKYNENAEEDFKIKIAT